MSTIKTESLYHLVQRTLWDATLATNEVYYPPTYELDGFTHGTAKPDLLLGVANHFYQDIPGEWLCLEMTLSSLHDAGVKVVFEVSAPVGDKAAEIDGTEGELFPHIYGGIPAASVIAIHKVVRSDNGMFLSVKDVAN